MYSKSEIWNVKLAALILKFEIWNAKVGLPIYSYLYVSLRKTNDEIGQNGT